MTRVLLGSVLHFISLSLVFQCWSSREPPRLHLLTVTKLPFGSTRFSGFSDLAFREGQVEELHDATAFVNLSVGKWHRHRIPVKEKIFMVIFHPKYLTNVIYESNLSGRFSFKKENQRITGRTSTAGHLRLLRSVGSARGGGCLLVLEAEFVLPAFRAFRLFQRAENDVQSKCLQVPMLKFVTHITYHHISSLFFDVGRRATNKLREHRQISKANTSMRSVFAVWKPGALVCLTSWGVDWQCAEN